MSSNSIEAVVVGVVLVFASDCQHFMSCVQRERGHNVFLILRFCAQYILASYVFGLDETILEECLQYLEKQLESSQARKAMEEFFSERGELVQIMMATANENLSAKFCNRVLKFFTKLFQLAEKSPNPSLLHLCGSFAQLACVEHSRLHAWLTRMTHAPPKDSDQLDVVQENRQLLQILTACIVRENSKKYLSQKNVLEKVGANVTQGKHVGMLDCACHIMSYLADVMNAMRQNSGQGSTHLVVDGEERAIEVDSDWVEDLVVEEEDSQAEDSICYSLKGAELIGSATVMCLNMLLSGKNIKWVFLSTAFDGYHCHTCKMVEGVGVCTICAKVCHKDHEISYAKYGSFFCDCGAKEDGSCQ
eukprot:g45357.t1